MILYIEPLIWWHVPSLRERIDVVVSSSYASLDQLLMGISFVRMQYNGRLEECGTV